MVITKPDGTTERIEAATKVWAAGTRAVGLGRTLADHRRRAGPCGPGARSQPDCSWPGYPEIFVVGDLMALDDLPALAEVAMQSGAHAAHTIDAASRGRHPSLSATATSGRWR